MVKQKKPLKMRDFLARVGSLRILYRYPCPHSTKLYFVCPVFRGLHHECLEAILRKS